MGSMQYVYEDFVHPGARRALLTRLTRFVNETLAELEECQRLGYSISPDITDSSAFVDFLIEGMAERGSSLPRGKFSTNEGGVVFNPDPPYLESKGDLMRMLSDYLKSMTDLFVAQKGTSAPPALP